MKFPNATRGVKNIRNAVLLLIIATALSGVAGLTALAGEESPLVFVGVAAVLAACALMIIALIMKIVGVNRASKDEAAFKTALIVLVIGIVADVVTGAFNSSNALVSNLGSFAARITEIIAGYFICTGIINLADRLENAEVSENGKKVRNMLVCIWGVSAVLSLLAVIFSKNTTLASIFGIACSVISLIVYIIYFGLLNKANKMLAE